MFCTNAIDHALEPETIIDEIERILKAEGELFIHLHLRSPSELNKIHPFPWDKEKFLRLFRAFEILSCEIEDYDRVNQAELRTLFATVRKN